MALKDWSTTAASNATVGSINWAEGQAPNTVNNSAREEMADVRTFYENIEWRDWGHSVTRTGNTTFTISSATDLTSIYAVGRRIKCVDSSDIYGTIAASSHAASTQTVTVNTDSGNLSASLSSVELGIDIANRPYPIYQISNSGVLCPHENLVITNINATNSNNQVDVTADELVLTDGSGNFLKVSSVSISDADITTDASGGGTSGYANGYTRGANEWAYMWVVSNGVNTYLLYDEVGSAPDLTGFTDYYYGLVGAVRNISSAFMDFHQTNDTVNLDGLKSLVVSGTSTSYTTLNSNLAIYAPAIATEVFGVMVVRNSTANDTSTLFLSAGSSNEWGRQQAGNPGANQSNMSINYRIKMNSAQTLYYKVSAGSGTAVGSVYMTGFKY